MAVSVNLGEKLEAFIDEAVNNGRYGSRSEVLREGIRLVQEREALWAKFEAEMMPAIEDSKAGRVKPAEEVFEEVRARIRQIAMKGKAKQTA